MASDVLKDLVRALCSLDIVEPPRSRRGIGAAPKSTPLSEGPKETAQEAA